MRSQQKRGLKIAHNLEDFEEGQEIILTLQDQPILNPNNKKDYELNEEPDILENINLKEKEELEFNQRMKDEIKQKQLGGAYNYEDKFAMEKKLLPQYDEERPQKSGLFLDDQGEYNAQKINKIQEIKNKLLKKNNNEIQLYQDRRIQSEYYDEREERRFKVPLKKKFKKKEKSKTLADILEETAEEESKDHGSRKLQIMQAKQQEEYEGNLQKKVKTENYENALDKAKQDIEQHQDKTNFKLFFEEEQDELEKAIEKQRKIQQEKKKNEIEILLEKNSKLENPEQRRLSSQDFNKIIESEKSSVNGKQVLNTIITTTDFLKNIQTQIEQQEIKQKIMQPTKYGISDTKEGTTSVVNISLPSEKLMNFCRNSEAVSTFGYQSAFNRQFYSKSSNQKQQPQSLIKEPQPKQQNEEEDQSQQPDLQQQPEENEEELLEKCKEELQCLKEDNIGTGLAKALEFLRQRGDLIDEGKEYAGRARDKTQFQEEGKYGPKREGMGGEKLDLEYRDDSGRIMTPKEAFRYLCWIFHGKKPGKNKIDKKMKKQQLEQKTKFSDPQNTPLLKALNKHANKTNQPYMVLGQLQQPQQF